MISFRAVSKQYPGATAPALNQIDLDIKAGEFVSIVGQSGTGKTTLVKLIIAEEKPTGGNITVGGFKVDSLKNRDVPFLRRQIGVVFQDFKLLPKRTVAENIAFALEVANEPRARIKQIVEHALDIVGLNSAGHRYPHELSGGEQQRAVIARSIAHRPKILVADEPTGNLDAVHTAEIVHILKKIHEFGTTILLVTHNRDVVNQLRERVITLQNGTIVADAAHGTYRLS